MKRTLLSLVKLYFLEYIKAYDPLPHDFIKSRFELAVYEAVSEWYADLFPPRKERDAGHSGK